MSHHSCNIYVTAVLRWWKEGRQVDDCLSQSNFERRVSYPVFWELLESFRLSAAVKLEPVWLHMGSFVATSIQPGALCGEKRCPNAWLEYSQNGSLCLLGGIFSISGKKKTQSCSTIYNWLNWVTLDSLAGAIALDAKSNTCCPDQSKLERYSRLVGWEVWFAWPLPLHDYQLTVFLTAVLLKA